MVLHYRHKNRILTTLVTAIALVLCINVYFVFNSFMSLEMSLLFTFALGILFLTFYHLYIYEHCHEHVTMVNNLTQVYFGVVLLLSVSLMLLLRWFFAIELATSYIILSVIVLSVIFLTLGSFDRFLENHLSQKFPMGAPEPSKQSSRERVRVAESSQSHKKKHPVKHPVKK